MTSLNQFQIALLLLLQSACDHGLGDVHFYTNSAFHFFSHAAIIPGHGLFVLLDGEMRICVSGE